MGMHQPFESLRYNTHWVPFRFTTSFIHFSSVQSTRCQLFCSPAIPTSAAFTLRLLIAHSYLISQSTAKVHLHSSAAFVPWREIYYGGFLWSWHRSSHLAKLLYINPISGCYFTASPFVGLAGTSVRSSLQCLMAARHQRYSADKCAARLCFFFAAGAFTGRLKHSLLSLLKKDYWTDE